MLGACSAREFFRHTCSWQAPFPCPGRAGKRQALCPHCIHLYLIIITLASPRSAITLGFTLPCVSRAIKKIVKFQNLASARVPTGARFFNFTQQAGHCHSATQPNLACGTYYTYHSKFKPLGALLTPEKDIFFTPVVKVATLAIANKSRRSALMPSRSELSVLKPTRVSG